MEGMLHEFNRAPYWVDSTGYSMRFMHGQQHIIVRLSSFLLAESCSPCLANLSMQPLSRFQKVRQVKDYTDSNRDNLIAEHAFQLINAMASFVASAPDRTAAQW
eukprot:4487-Pelagomonas_calceolata.AAC.2